MLRWDGNGKEYKLEDKEVRRRDLQRINERRENEREGRKLLVEGKHLFYQFQYEE